ncbi:uncharacterized protein RJT21DRAFT_35499 [Scheffersomyces amazonensis]|uniref:uncharacterized protein n=1 Tax=Scheffersomyces amazonensis TaxID=1078765 RepID=UPI00315C63D5
MMSIRRFHQRQLLRFRLGDVNGLNSLLISCRHVHVYSSRPATSMTRRPINYINKRSYGKFEQEIEKLKYDQMLRDRLISSGIGNDTHLKDKRRLPLKTIILLIATSSTLTMVVYVITQLIKFYGETDDDNDEIKTKRRAIFLPIWLNLNLLWQKSFTFPGGIMYLDKEYYEYLMVEIDQLIKNKSQNPDLVDYLKLLEDENIKYSVLEHVSMNHRIKEIFGLPLTISSIEDDPSTPHLSLWVESKYISVSGIQIELERYKSIEGQTHENKFKANASWVVKPINIITSINNALISLGLKLDRLDNEQIKTHERSSGKIHEVPIVDNKDHKVINGPKDYEIKFKGELQLSDKNHFESGIIKYQGQIDFDHLMINRGVKITTMELIMSPKSNPGERITYKIL